MNYHVEVRHPGALARLVLLTLLGYLVVWGLVGCEQQLITDGEIYGREHRSAQTMLIMMPLTHCYGAKPRVCSTTMIPLLFHYPERWCIDIKKYQGGRWVTARYWVPEDTYNQAQIGGYLELDEPFDTAEPRQRVREKP